MDRLLALADIRDVQRIGEWSADEITGYDLQLRSGKDSEWLAYDIEQMIFDALRNGERLVDDVIAETGLTTGKILGLLTMMELKGHIRRLPGKRIALKQ